MAKNKDDERAPLCVGDYEVGDSQCDGDSGASRSEDVAPCGWRNRCAALQCYLGETDRDISELVELKTSKELVLVPDETTGQDIETYEDQEHAYSIGPWKKFEALLEKQVQRYGIRDGRPTKDPVGDPPPKPERAPQPDRRKFLKPSKKAQRAAKKALSKRAQERRSELDRLFQYFIRHLATELKDSGYKFAKPKHGLGRGTLYIVNRLDKSGYMSVYCNNPMGRDAALVSAKYKPRDLTLDMMMPFEVDQVTSEERKKLNLESLENGGLFRSVAMGLKKEGVAHAAETIAALVKSGRVDLPEAAL